MKKITIILTFCLLVFGFQESNAQLFKKLKKKINEKVDQVEQRIENKVENKVDEKIDKTLDGTIDGIFEKKQNTPPYSEKNETGSSSDADNKTYSGTISLDHGQNYGSIQINTLGNLKIERTNEGYNFYGNWFSHEVDVFDGYALEIQTDENLELGKTYTFNISKNANFRIGYDPELPATKDGDDFKKGISDEYQNLDLSSGLIKVKINEDKSFEIDFSGQAEFIKRTRNSSNEVSESFYTASVMGNIQGEKPQFLDNKSITKKTVNEGSTASSTSSPSSSSSSSVQAANQYVFTHETKVKVTNLEENETYNMSYLLNPSVEYVGLKTDMSEYSDEEMAGESVVIMDGDNVHIFVETQGMKMQMSQNMMGGQQQNPTDKMADYDYSNITKTGNTKTILDAICYEYVMADKDVKMNIWVAPSISLPNWFIKNNEVIEGHIMEYTISSKDGNVTSETIAINDNINQTINPTDYKKMF